MKNYETLSEAINDLRQQGYLVDFNLKNDSIESAERELAIHPSDFEIDEIHRFDDMTNPDDESILYAISSKNHSIKGLLINAYGTYSDNFSSNLVAKLTQHLKEE